MDISLNQFLEKYKTALIEKASLCLSGRISPGEAREYVWYIMDEWEKFINNEEIEEKYAKGEKAFWAIVWVFYTSVVGDSWEDNLPPECLVMYIDLLRRGQDLPKGHDDRRP